MFCNNKFFVQLQTATIIQMDCMVREELVILTVPDVLELATIIRILFEATGLSPSK